MTHLSNVWFKVTDLEVVSGRGCRVTTVGGDEYLDFAAGIAVNSTGHSHPHVVDAISRQAGRFIHAQVNVFTHDLLEPLAARLAELAPGAIDTFFFANSGAEITEAAVKLAKQVTGRPNIVVFDGSFHGRTHLTMAMTTSKTGVPGRPRAAAVGHLRRPVPRSARGRRDRRGAPGARRRRPGARDAHRARRDGGDDPRAGPRRGWLRTGAAGVRHRARRPLPRARDPLRRRRGAERLRADGEDVRRRAPRRRARRDLHGQGDRLGLPVRRPRHPPRARRPVATRQSRRHLRRQPDRLRRGAGDDRGDDRAGVPGQRRRARPAADGRPRRAAAIRTRPASGPRRGPDGGDRVRRSRPRRPR